MQRNRGNNSMGKTRYRFKKIRDTKGTFHAKMGTIKKTVSNVKRQPSEWEKIIANEATDKESPKYTSSSCSSIPEK